MLIFYSFKSSGSTFSRLHQRLLAKERVSNFDSAYAPALPIPLTMVALYWKHALVTTGNLKESCHKKSIRGLVTYSSFQGVTVYTKI